MLNVQLNDRVYVYRVNQQGRLLFIEANPAGKDPLDWINTNRDFFEQSLKNYGGVVLRNFAVDSASQFNKLAQAISPKLLDYVYRSTPRTSVGGKIYTATEYPPALSIPLHNENSYSQNWPNIIMFYCAIAALEGGETPVADSRRVLARIPADIIDIFDKKKLMYVRNYHESLDLSWETVFQTENKLEVEAYCQQNNIKYQWQDKSPFLRTWQICQATWQHPLTQEKVWFNQAHLFHISNLELSDQKTLLNEFGIKNIPRNVYYGDGSEIENEALEIIRSAYEAEKITFKWLQGDVMILDNILMAHGRCPFKGDRKILVAMS